MPSKLLHCIVGQKNEVQSSKFIQITVVAVTNGVL